MPASDLPVVEFAFPGPLRDQLVAAILAGEKTTTTGLVADYERENEPLPGPGLRQVVINSADRPVAVIETTEVRVMRLGDVDLDHALGELWSRLRITRVDYDNEGGARLKPGTPSRTRPLMHAE